MWAQYKTEIFSSRGKEKCSIPSTTSEAAGQNCFPIFVYGSNSLETFLTSGSSCFLTWG